MAIGRRSWSRARASLVAVLRYVHEHLDIPVATMGTAADNLPALRQIERAGATATDTRPHTLPNGQTVTSCWFEHRA